jgi:peptide-methionine (S)-S-oxide reductase
VIVEVATFASGCYWGTEHIFVKHYGQKGILKTAVGFTGGDVSNPSYRAVCTGNTGHAEALRVEFDPEKVGYGELVGVYSLSIICMDILSGLVAEFFYRTHNPTTLNRQGNDAGTRKQPRATRLHLQLTLIPEYRSAIFTNSPEQEKIAKEVTAEVQAKRFDPLGKRIVTTILPAGEWFDAEESHQMYLFKNPSGYQCETHRLHW